MRRLFPATRLDVRSIASICVIALCLGLIGGVLAARAAPSQAGTEALRSVPTVADEPPPTPCDALLESRGACPPFRSA
ncbi:MAG: hypothetical protein KDG55_16440 [Rhodocyclaceae bacterium]|nr:hypothetical protein [Rhodocyclaceae bacterium]